MVAPVRKYTAPKILSDVVKYEEEIGYSRETGTLKAGETLALGTPISIDAGGLIVALTVDGSLACKGVALNAVAAGESNAVGAALYIARQAVIADSGLEWPAGISAPHKAKAIAELAALPGPVVVRAAV